MMLALLTLVTLDKPLGGHVCKALIPGLVMLMNCTPFWLLALDKSASSFLNPDSDNYEFILSEHPQYLKINE